MAQTHKIMTRFVAADVFRQCAQVALTKLGIYHGQLNTDTEEWPVVWERYLESHQELRNDQRQATIRAVIDRELAAKGERIDWDACAG